MKRTRTAQVISTHHALCLGAGSHPAITDTLHLPAGQSVPVPADALPYLLSLPGVEQAATPDSPEPTNSEE